MKIKQPVGSRGAGYCPACGSLVMDGGVPLADNPEPGDSLEERCGCTLEDA